ncbi:MAG: AI-2E family transporter [Dehalococcoidia bacterium]
MTAHGLPESDFSLRAVGDVAWRIVGVALLLFVLGTAFARLRLVLLPLLFALMLTSLLLPARRRLERLGLPRPVAAVVVLVSASVVLVAASVWLGRAVVGEAPALRATVSSGVDELSNWATGSPLNLPRTQVESFVAQLRSEWTSNQQHLLHGALANVPLALELSIGAVFTLVLTIFLVIDGDGIWNGLLAVESPLLPPMAIEAATRGWSAITSYARGVVVNAVVNAGVIGTGLRVLGVPLALPIAGLTFVGSFVPILGGIVAGGIAVVVALAANGFGTAVAVLGLALLAHAAEAYIVGPQVMGRVVHLHPLTVLIVVSAGSALAGVTGAIVAVPLAATATSMLVSGPADDERAEPVATAIEAES